MKLIVRKAVSTAVAAVMAVSSMQICECIIPVCGINAYASQSELVVLTAAGWHESAYARWTEYDGADSYNV